MSHYLVRAKQKKNSLDGLKVQLKNGAIRRMRPFGTTLQNSLTEARLDREQGHVLWEEEDYCTPPLRQEREAVLDDYFELLEITEVEPGAGWRQIEGLPGLWSKEDTREFDRAVDEE